MEKFIRFGNVEVEIKSDFNSSYENKKSWKDAKDDLMDRELRLPTLRELEYIHNLLYLNHGGYFEEGSEYWTSDISYPWAEGTTMACRKTLRMNYQGTPSQKYIYSIMRYRGVRDV